MPTSPQNWHHFGKKVIAFVAIAALQINTMAPALAALAQKPLLSSSGATPKPNVILSLDNSESMAFNHMPESLAGTNIVRMHPEDDLSIASHTLLRSVAGYVPATGNCNDNVFECRMRSPDVNTIYYNPATYYRPWVNAANPGTRLPDSSFKAAPINPLNQTKTVDLGASVSLNEATNVRWCSFGTNCTDSKKAFTPGIYYRQTGKDASLATSYSLVNVGTSTPSHNRTTYPQRLDCPTTGNCSQAAEQTNFANWFTYYRARILFTKAALLEAFATQGDTIRLGWGFTSSVSEAGGSASGAPTVDGMQILGGPSQGVRDFTDTHRLTFLSAMQNISLRGSTPLRFVMDGVGQYFKNSARPWRDNPATDTGAMLSCRRAYNILTTDGYYNDNGTVDFNYGNMTSRIGDVDGQTVSDTTGTRYTPTRPYADAASASTLADIAMYYWANDLNLDIPNNVLKTPIKITDPDYYDTAKDPATWQHLTQFTVGVGVSGSLNPTTDLAALKNGTKSWPTISSDPSKIDDLWHAAVNSRGQFYEVKDAGTFKTAIKNAIGQAQNAPLSEGGVSTAGTTIQDSTRKYVSSYITNKDGPWSGDFYAYNLNTSGKVVGEKAWSATDLANGKTAGVPAMVPADRNIVIWNADDNTATAFDWGPMGASNQGLMPGGSEALVKYLRGDTSLEGTSTGQYRERNGARFADFINSNIVYVKDHVNLKYGGLPAVALGMTALPGGNDPTGYAAFLDKKARRKPAVVFIGSNGGFLHGFQDNAGSTASADTELNKRNGAELFAFVPRGVLANLPKLAQQDYGRSGGTNEHQYFVDGLMTESDAHVGGSWRNVLVGSLAAGGKGIYALNVTDLDALGTSSVLWDKTLPSTTTDDAEADVGYIVTAPQVGVLPNGKWKVFVGNGYDSRSGQAALLMYNLSDGSLESIPVGPVGGNGLGGVVLLRNSNQEVIGAYAGDLRGNLWRFEYSAKLGRMVQGYAKNTPLFIAKSSTGATQPITAAPAVVPHASLGNVIVFGTGKLLESTDKSNTSARQSVYGIWDQNRVALDVDTTELNSPFTLTGTVNPRDGKLIQQTITAGRLPGSYNVSSAQQTSSSLGWYMDLTIQDGQRLIYPVQTIRDYVLLGTVVPSATATDCENLNAKGYNFLLPGLTGAQADTPILDINGDGVVTKDDGSHSGYETGADGNDTMLPGGGSDPTPPGPDCSIQNTSGDVKCNLPPPPDDPKYNVQDRVWKRLLNVPQPGL